MEKLASKIYSQIYDDRSKIQNDTRRRKKFIMEMIPFQFWLINAVNLQLIDGIN